MELKLKTEKLKEMVAKAVKGASNNKLIPLTSLMCVQLKNGTLTLITAEARNYLYIRETGVEGDDFYVVIEVETFSKLVARMTCETATLTLQDGSLNIKGNGDYTIALPMDEEGNMVKYPDPLLGLELEGEGKEINQATIRTILDTIKPSLATTLEIPCYTAYYIGDTVIGTDTYKIASMAVKLFDEPKLVSQEMMNLLSVMTAEKISVDIKDNILVFTSPDVAVYGTEVEGIEDYQAEAINNLVATEFESSCKMPKSALLQVLDRLALFVSTYDKNGINLVFTNEGLQISSKASNGVEMIKYSESKNFKDYTCLVDIIMLTSQIKAYAGDVVELQYGGTKPALKFVDGNITQIISLMADE